MIINISIIESIIMVILVILSVSIFWLTHIFLKKYKTFSNQITSEIHEKLLEDYNQSIIDTLATNKEWLDEIKLHLDDSIAELKDQNLKHYLLSIIAIDKEFHIKDKITEIYHECKEKKLNHFVDVVYKDYLDRYDEKMNKIERNKYKNHII